MSAFSVFAGACAFLSASLVGLWLKRRLLNKADFYKDYYDFLCYALEKISSERTVVSEIKRTFQGKSKDFTELLKGNEVSAPIGEKERNAVKEYLSGIGSTDAESQIASLSSKCSTLKRFVENECAAYRKDAALRFKLAVLVGAALFIILV